MTKLAERSGLERTHLYRKLKRWMSGSASAETNSRVGFQGRNRGSS